ncbi:hypothetical protein BDZ94DRAFT_1275485 [Collybia nuda]|uniref:Uncharacterized protein n=1 Tax=Collybia nuda TaxID=64659 RepID=A0A9P6CCZ4_9AGAR|nr:hypothetical protein BDZ94DRAFT_1275485 [Collybia nuda]
MSTVTVAWVGRQWWWCQRGAYWGRTLWASPLLSANPLLSYWPHIPQLRGGGLGHGFGVVLASFVSLVLALALVVFLSFCGIDFLQFALKNLNQSH